MGIATNFKIAFYTKEKKLIEKYYLKGRADDFVYGLVDDGGATFEPLRYGDFTEHQIEIMKIYFDEESMSVGEGEATVTPNVQDPKELEEIWTKIRTSIIKSFNSQLKNYRASMIENIGELKSKIEDSNKSKSGFFSKKELIEIPNQSIELDDYNFNGMLFEFTWSLNSISKVMACLELAIKNDNLVEITVSDY